MGFTTAKEAGDPDADFVCRGGQGSLVVIQEGIEMAAKLTGDDILPEFLLDAPLVILSNLNDAIDVAVNVAL